MLPALRDLLETVPKQRRSGWVISPLPIQYEIKSYSDWFRPTDDDLSALAKQYSNRSIAAACGVSDTAVRKWLSECRFQRNVEFQYNTGTITPAEIRTIRKRATMMHSYAAQRADNRLTKERVGRITAMIGESAGVIVQQPDDRTRHRVKFASAHDLRRGCAQRLINAGVSAEALKVIMRHRDFATTERYYGAMRSAQSAAAEVVAQLSAHTYPDSFVGGLVGGHEADEQLSPEELLKLKSLLNSY